MLRRSDPDDRGGGCEGRRGAAVVVQVDHGVVAGCHAAKGGACAHLSVPQALQVTLGGAGEGREAERHGSDDKQDGRSRHQNVQRTHAFQGDTDRCQQIPSVTFDWGGFTAVRAFLPTCLLPLLGILLSNPHQLDSFLSSADDNCKRKGGKRLC